MNCTEQAIDLPAALGGRNIVMIGPPPEGRGGMSSVVAAYRDAGMFERCSVRMLATTSDAGALGKLRLAIAASLRFMAWLASGRVALVHIHVASGVSFWRKAVFCQLAWWFRVPYLFHLHGGNFPEFYARSSAPARRFIRTTMRRAQRVVVLSEAWKGRLGAMVDASHCEVIENPVATWARRPRGGGDETVFLFLGRLEPAKGVPELLDAFANLSRAGLRVRLRLAGDGDIDATRRRIAELGLADRVEILGWITGERKREALDAADAFVLPSHIEGLPVSMLEAMHCALPVIICPVGSIPEVLSDGVNALFVQPRDTPALAAAMRALVTAPDLRRRLGQAGRTLFESRYSMDSVGPRIEALYACVLGEGGVRRLDATAR